MHTGIAEYRAVLIESRSFLAPKIDAVYYVYTINKLILAADSSIRIQIPHPCNQEWNDMIPEAQGRFCSQCQTTVIDFTTWSDAALYRFFAKNTSHVCGRFLATQTERPIHIPHQPHGRLYRMTIALGLTLLFTQTPDLLAQNRAPIVAQPFQNKDRVVLPEEYVFPCRIHGNVTDNRKEGLVNAYVSAYKDGALKGSTVTDYDGNYSVKLTEPGIYELTISYDGYSSFKTTESVANGSDVVLNCVLRRQNVSPGKRHVISGAALPKVHHPKQMATDASNKKDIVITGGIRPVQLAPAPEKENAIPDSVINKQFPKEKGHR